MLEILLQHCSLCTDLINNRNGRGKTPLMVAARKVWQAESRHIETVETLVSYGCDVNLEQDGHNALSLVVEDSNQENMEHVDIVTELLLDYGADVGPSLRLCSTRSRLVRQIDDIHRQLQGRRGSTGALAPDLEPTPQDVTPRQRRMTVSDPETPDRPLRPTVELRRGLTAPGRAERSARTRRFLTWYLRRT